MINTNPHLPPLSSHDITILEFIRLNPGLTHEDICNELAGYDNAKYRKSIGYSIEFIVQQGYDVRNVINQSIISKT